MKKGPERKQLFFLLFALFLNPVYCQSQTGQTNWFLNGIRDKANNLWFATTQGVFRYDGKSFTHFDAKDGLRNLDVWTILEDKDSNIWIVTKVNLYRFHSPSGKFVEYTHKMNAK